MHLMRLERRGFLRTRKWQIERELATLRIVDDTVFGRPSVERFGTEQAALDRFEALVQRQLDQGYTVVARHEPEPDPHPLEAILREATIAPEDWAEGSFTAPPAPIPIPPAIALEPAPAARNPALEAAIIDADEDANWRVYADWLLAQGDPLGAHINRCMDDLGPPDRSAEPRQDTEQTIRARPAWFGEALCRHLARGGHNCFRLELRRGFIHRAWVGVGWDREPDLRPLLAALLDSPAARFLRGLQLGLAELDDVNHYEHLVPLLRERAPLLALEELVVGAFAYPEETEISWTEVGDIGALPGCCPRLRSLKIRGGQIELGRLAHPTLERLTIESGGLNLSALRSVLDAELPRLRELELWLGDAGYGAEAQLHDFDALFGGERFPELEVLRLRNAEISDELAAALARSKLLPRLRVLDLSMGTLHAPGAAVLRAQRDRFAHLERLDLRDNYLDDSDARALASPTVLTGEQRQVYVHPGVEPARYVSVGE